jgi:hypothetical protein
MLYFVFRLARLKEHYIVTFVGTYDLNRVPDYSET